MAPRLLLVEDEPGVREMVGEYLRGRGFAVEDVATLARAREVLDASAFDVVLTDLRLTDGEGTELLPLLSPRGPAVVVMTAWATPEVAVTLLTAGVAELVLKPFKLQALYRVVTGAVARRAEHRARDRDAAAGRWLERLVTSAEPEAVAARVPELEALVAEHLPGARLRVHPRPAGPGERRLGAARAAEADPDPHLDAWLAALDQAFTRVGG